MASVFLCEDERLGREVAIKRLHPYGPPEDGVRRFKREARVGASLNHPGLVAVFDTVPDVEGDLIVMEYVPGESLADALKRGPLSSGRAAEVVSALAAALDHAHARGVLHRDIKPGNVLLRDDGAVKLADLGIATAAEQTRITQSGTVLGTAAYMAPEQLAGHDAEVRSDVYALAVVAFEALSGRRARLGTTPLEVAQRIAAEPPPDLREAWPDAPAAASRVLARGMARRPEDRPETAGELADGLHRALLEPGMRATKRIAIGSAPSSSPPLQPSPLYVSGRGSPRRWIPAAALGALLLSVAIAVALLGDGSPEKSERATAPPERSGKANAPARRRERAEAPAAPATSEPEGDAQDEPQGAEVVSDSGESGPALNEQGYALMQQGRYDEAIPLLERALAVFPDGTTDIDYAYALYNLGRSLRLVGRFDEAIPILERRLQIPDQTATVRRELEAAHRSSRRP